MTLTNCLKRTAVGLGLFGVLAGCGPGSPPVRAHTDVYAREDVSPQLRRSNALYDIRRILEENCVKGRWSVDEQGISCTDVRMSWEEVGTRTLTAEGVSFRWGPPFLSLGYNDRIYTRDKIQAEQLKYSIEMYLRYKSVQ